MTEPQEQMIQIPAGKQAFVVLGMMRSGSNLLQQKINAIGGVMCHGEIFNKSQTGLNPGFKKAHPQLESLTSIDKNKTPLRYLEKLLELSDAEHVGFRLFESHNNTLVKPLVEDTRIFKIILVRDLLESYASLEIAKQTNQWLLNNPKGRADWKPVNVNFDTFRNYALRQSLFYNQILKLCLMTGQKCLVLDYPELNSRETDVRLLDHFGSDRSMAESKVTLRRQNPEGLREKIENFDEIHEKIHKLRLETWLPGTDAPLGSH